mmetsp:Transcript_7543/g.17738  ORF Transcript_7543/g.17738 Transcript_7543/m.17738 type:complete len:228 (-) Transcript_7543:720-1403(-)
MQELIGAQLRAWRELLLCDLLLLLLLLCVLSLVCGQRRLLGTSARAVHRARGRLPVRGVGRALAACGGVCGLQRQRRVRHLEGDHLRHAEAVGEGAVAGPWEVEDKLALGLDEAVEGKVVLCKDGRVQQHWLEVQHAHAVVHPVSSHLGSEGVELLAGGAWDGVDSTRLALVEVGHVDRALAYRAPTARSARHVDGEAKEALRSGGPVGSQLIRVRSSHLAKVPLLR